MVTIVKHEWHSHDRQYAIELDEDLLSEIYPDLDEDEIAQKLADIESGEITVDEVMEDAYDNDVEIEWDFQYDDCWTDRKGGYDITYELGDENSWHTEPEPPAPTHKCTNCKWTGQSYDGDWVWQDKEGNDLDESKQVCPYCESDLELTPEGIIKEEERKKRMAEIDAMFDDEQEEVPCFSCGAKHLESELPLMDGQLVCPSCGEGWIMSDAREDLEDETQDLEEALEELKQEFELLMEAEEEEQKSKKKKKK